MSQVLEELLDALADRIVQRIEAARTTSAPKRLLSLKEAGEYMGGKTARAVGHMVSAGTIPQEAVKRFGERRIFIDRAELDKWIDAQ